MNNRLSLNPRANGVKRVFGKERRVRTARLLSVAGTGLLASSALWLPAAEAIPRCAQEKLTPASEVEIQSRYPSSLTSQSAYVVAGIDCFGVGHAATCVALADDLGLKVGEPLKMGGTTLQPKSGEFAYLGVSPTFLPNGSVFLTIDALSSERLQSVRLRNEPKEQVKLSTNLLELYGDFFAAKFQQKRRGNGLGESWCDGVWSYSDGTLAEYSKLFQKTVGRHRKELVQALLNDEDASIRRAAAGLLGYDQNTKLVTDALQLALTDPDMHVRAEAAHALLPKIRHSVTQGESPIELGPVTQMFNLPTSADRASALALLETMVTLPTLRGPALASSQRVLLEMLKSKQPRLRKRASQVLTKATGLNLGLDADRWEDALKQHPVSAARR